MNHNKPYICFEGILHPKMTILSSFTHPQVVSNLCEFLSSAEHKDILKNDCNFSNIDFHSRKKILWKSMVPKFQSFLKYLCVQQKKETHRSATT